jgi:hypothetical protein
MTGLQAALAEAHGEGNFTVTGRRLIYTRGNCKFKWDCKNKADAAETLAVFRELARRRIEEAQLEVDSRPLPRRTRYASAPMR